MTTQTIRLSEGDLSDFPRTPQNGRYSGPPTKEAKRLLWSVGTLPDVITSGVSFYGVLEEDLSKTYEEFLKTRFNFPPKSEDTHKRVLEIILQNISKALSSDASYGFTTDTRVSAEDFLRSNKDVPLPENTKEIRILGHTDLFMRGAGLLVAFAGEVPLCWETFVGY